MKEEENNKKPEASQNKAKDVETKGRRKELAAELGELMLVRAKLAAQIRTIDERSNQLAQLLEQL